MNQTKNLTEIKIKKKCRLTKTKKIYLSYSFLVPINLFFFNFGYYKRELIRTNNKEKIKF